MTNNVSRCDYYQGESQNVKGKYYCKPPATYMNELTKVNIPRRIPKIPITKEECEVSPCQLTFTCSKSTVETLDKGVKYVQS